MVAEALDVEFYFAEPYARTPVDGLFPVGYRIPAPLRPEVAGKFIAIVDDVINAGSAVGGAIGGLLECGARPTAIAGLLVPGRSAADLAVREDVPLLSLGRLPGHLRTPDSYPLCAAGSRVEGTGCE